MLGDKLGSKSSPADPDLWYKPLMDPYGFKYYSYILVYVYGFLIIDNNTNKFMDMVKYKFTVKPYIIE